LNAVEDEKHSDDDPAQEPLAAESLVETEAARVAAAAEATANVQSAPPEDRNAATADAVVFDDAANDEQAPLAASNGRQATSTKTSVQPRHPEWPAESFLTRSWLPRDPDFAANGRENGVCHTETTRQRNGCTA
jgi:hypothetical protein